jgi:hypothetical protein
MASPTNDALVIAILRHTLDDVFADHRFFVRTSMSACQVAEFILSLALRGERDINVLRASAFKRLSDTQPARLRTNVIPAPGGS